MHTSQTFNEVMLEPEEFMSRALLATVMAVDTETNGKDIRDGRGYAVGISAAVHIGDSYYHSYFPVAHYEGNISDDLKKRFYQLIETRLKIIFHNAKFDLDSMETAGFSGNYVKWYCTMMMAHFLNENEPKGLDYLSKRILGNSGKVTNNFESIWRMGMGHMIPVAEMKLYAGIDTVRTLQLFEVMYPHFVKSGFDGPSPVQ